MAKRSIVVEGDTILRKVTQPAFANSSYTKSVIRDLWDTVQNLGSGCVGLAANQIGECVSIFVMRRGTRVFINPKIIHRVGKFPSRESCYSIPGYEAIVPRAKQITMSYQEQNGNVKIYVSPNQFEAVVVQHEIDHLNGIFIRDYVDKSHDKTGGILVNSYSLKNPTYIAYAEQSVNRVIAGHGSTEIN